MRGHTLAIALAILVPATLAHADDDDDAEQAPKPKKKKKPKPDADDGAAADADADDGGSITADQASKKKKSKKKQKKTPQAQDGDGATQGAAATAPPTDASTTVASTTTRDGGASNDSLSASASAGVAEHDVAPTRFRFAGELLGAGPLDSGNRQFFGFGGGVGLGVTIFVTELLDAHVAAEIIHLGNASASAADPMPQSTNNFVGQLGPRVHLAQFVFGHPTHHDAWADAHFRFGASGGIARPGFDVGGAFQWEVTPALRLGPVVRYQFGSDPLAKNAQVFTLGLAVGFGGRARIPTHVVGDRDGDGVADAIDQCPDTPAGPYPDPKKPGCPSDDRDGDGVRDADDLCPDKPAGKHPDPSRLGCPFEDRDGDNIADADDKCPDQPGPPNPFDPSKHGCPVLAKVVANKIEILEEIFFETDSATIKSESFAVLEAVSAILKQLGDARVRVEGHTDQQGGDDYNLDLSRRRARAVAQWLITSGGVDAKRLETEGYGKTRPKVSGPNADLSKNRRVEFVILDDKK